MTKTEPKIKVKIKNPEGIYLNMNPNANLSDQIPEMEINNYKNVSHLSVNPDSNGEICYYFYLPSGEITYVTMNFDIIAKHVEILEGE